jgi:hypothetical protein
MDQRHCQPAGWRNAVDWRRLMSLARRWGVRRVLFLGLWLAHELSGARLEKSALRAVRREHTVDCNRRCHCGQPAPGGLGTRHRARNAADLAVSPEDARAPAR